MAAAAKEAGAQRVVLVSSMLVTRKHWWGPQEAVGTVGVGYPVTGSIDSDYRRPGSTNVDGGWRGRRVHWGQRVRCAENEDGEGEGSLEGRGFAGGIAGRTLQTWSGAKALLADTAGGALTL